MSIPVQAGCDPDNPEEFALWALLHLPRTGVPMLMHPSVLRDWSKHLWDLGFRHNPELQTKKLQRPIAGKQSPFNGSTQWVDIDTEEPPLRAIPDIASLTPEENAAMLAQYERAGMIPAPSDERDGAFSLT
ncbi:phage gene 29 protein family protein [Nocardia sp. IFM 10818]